MKMMCRYVVAESRADEDVPIEITTDILLAATTNEEQSFMDVRFSPNRWGLSLRLVCKSWSTLLDQFPLYWAELLAASEDEEEWKRMVAASGLGDSGTRDRRVAGASQFLTFIRAVARVQACAPIAQLYAPYAWLGPSPLPLAPQSLALRPVRPSRSSAQPWTSARTFTTQFPCL